MFLESQLLVCWLQPVWGLCAGGQHAVNFFYLVGNSHILHFSLSDTSWKVIHIFRSNLLFFKNKCFEVYRKVHKS